VQNSSDEIVLLIRKHIELERSAYDFRTGNSISGWQCLNVFAQLAETHISPITKSLSPSSYHYTDSIPELERDYIEPTKKLSDGKRDVLFGASSTALITSIVAWLKSTGIKTVAFIAPTYFTVMKSFALFGLAHYSVNKAHCFELDYRLDLSNCSCGALWITDPVWYAGVRNCEDTWLKIAAWQRATNGYVIVDSSFCGLSWQAELAPQLQLLLQPSKTFRIICPTKQLALHGYRAAYVECPVQLRNELQDVHEHLFGSLPKDTLAFLLAFPALRKLDIQRKLISTAKHVHHALRSGMHIAATWTPTDGYFVFERVISNELLDDGAMDGAYFQQNRLPGHYRVNLLSPQLARFQPHSDLGTGID
jgi:histidinol-phosphate/aromatic aminotransferase/cobyric acid decarboxylase-like protein